jgi:hypothetical protein
MIATFQDGTLTIAAGAFALVITTREIERNFDALTHSPDRRARIELDDLAKGLNGFAEFLDNLPKQGPVAASFDAVAELERFVPRHVSLTRAYWEAEARCMSAMIVGPAKFPTARNEKRLRASDNKAKEIRDHAAAARRAAHRSAFPFGADGDAIRGNDPDAAQKIREKIAKLEDVAERMKRYAAQFRKGGMEAVDASPALKASAADTLKACSWIKNPFSASPNKAAEIRRLRGRLKVMETRAARGTTEQAKETTAGEIRIVENVEVARIQLHFPDKPDDATRSLLKSNGFRWAPSEGAWQRHLNGNGRCAAERVLKALQPA